MQGVANHRLALSLIPTHPAPPPPGGGGGGGGGAVFISNYIYVSTWTPRTT